MTLSGEKSLQRLLRSMQPTVLPGNYAFVTVTNGKPIPPNLAPIATYKEPEGWSLIITEKEAITSGLPAAFPCKGISLNVHSSLYAVGFLAAVASRLAREGMSINIVSAYFRDYIFVPVDRAEVAVAALKKLATE